MYDYRLSYLTGQKLSACTCPGEDHPGPSVTTGRGAPEIDILEAGDGGVVSQSAVVAPFTHDYVYLNDTEQEWHVYNPNIINRIATRDPLYNNLYLASRNSPVISMMDQDRFSTHSVSNTLRILQIARMGISFGKWTTHRPSGWVQAQLVPIRVQVVRASARG